MNFINAARSVVRRGVSHQAIRSISMHSPPYSSMIRTVGANPMWRSFAAEAGYLDKDDVQQRVLDVVKKFEKVQPEKVTESSHFVNDLGLDSLDTVELVMAFEDEFAIEIPDTEAEKILSCTDAVSYLSNNVNAK